MRSDFSLKIYYVDSVCVCLFVCLGVGFLRIISDRTPTIFNSITCVCVCVCIVIPFILDAIRLVDVPAGVTTQEEGHRIPHPPSFCGACLNFYREKDPAIPFPRRP